MLASKFVKFLMSILKLLVNSSSNFLSFFSVITHTSSLSFQLMHFLLWRTGSHQSHNFHTFNCSGEILPNFSCHFPDHKSVSLQILHNSSMSWKITLLHFFRSSVIYFVRKGPVKVQIFETFECSDQNSPNSCHFWNNKSVFLQILHHFSVPWDNSSVLF